MEALIDALNYSKLLILRKLEEYMIYKSVAMSAM